MYVYCIHCMLRKERRQIHDMGRPIISMDCHFLYGISKQLKFLQSAIHVTHKHERKEATFVLPITYRCLRPRMALETSRSVNICFLEENLIAPLLVSHSVVFGYYDTLEPKKVKPLKHLAWKTGEYGSHIEKAKMYISHANINLEV